MFFRLFLIFLAASFCLNIPIAYSEQLTRARAKEEVIKNLKYPRPVAFPLKIGEDAPLNKGALDWFESLSREGLIKYNLRGDKFDIFLTEEGRKYAEVSSTDLHRAIGYLNSKQAEVMIKVGEELFDEITGIKHASDKTVIVEYTVRYGNKTPFFKGLESSPYYLHIVTACGDDAFSHPRPHTKRVRFAPWDDGWRVENRFLDIFGIK